FAFRATSKRNHRRRPQADYSQLLLHSKTELREGSTRIRVISRRLWHAGRNIRGADADADGKSPYHSDGAVGSAAGKLLGDLDGICYRSVAQTQLHFARRFFFF